MKPLKLKAWAIVDRNGSIVRKDVGYCYEVYPYKHLADFFRYPDEKVIRVEITEVKK